MEAAERLGISLARFDGREYATTYEYEDGRLVRSVTESEWTDEEQAWMLALAAYRAGRCPNCGGDIRECTAPDADGKFRVTPPTRCHASTALSIAQQAYTDSPQPEALLWRVNRR